MKTKEYVTQLKQHHVGKTFTAYISHDYCRGKINYYANSFYLCQNAKNGMACPDRLGYDYSWNVNDGTKTDLDLNTVDKLVIIDENREWDEENNE